MNLLENALKLLNRPTEGKPVELSKRRKNEAPAADAPLTQAELVAALEQLAADRETASATLAGAAELRESLLMQPGSDEAIFRLAQDIDTAQLTLERLDRLEPDLRAKLNQVERRDRNLRWIADRDAAVAALAQFAGAIDDYQAARATWSELWNRITEAWPTATEILPWMPALDTRRAQNYAEQLAEFAVQEIIPAPWVRAPLASLGAALAFTRQHGFPPPDVSSAWREICEQAIDPAGVEIIMAVNSLDAEGRDLAKGSLVSMPYEKAAALVQSGRARFKD